MKSLELLVLNVDSCKARGGWHPGA